MIPSPPTIRAVFEVLSPSTRQFDQVRKLEEYKSVASLRYTLLIDPDSPELIVFSWQVVANWISRTVEGFEAQVEFPDKDFSLPLTEIYSGLRFRAKPALVEPGA